LLFVWVLLWFCPQILHRYGLSTGLAITCAISSFLSLSQWKCIQCFPAVQKMQLVKHCFLHFRHWVWPLSVRACYLWTASTTTLTLAHS
jgi:hypothetical protein